MFGCRRLGTGYLGVGHLGACTTGRQNSVPDYWVLEPNLNVWCRTLAPKCPAPGNGAQTARRPVVWRPIVGAQMGLPLLEELYREVPRSAGRVGVPLIVLLL